MITLSIDVSKIDKSRFREVKGVRYMELTLIETPNSKYNNDYLVKQSSTKEERERKVQLPILGNAKIWESRGNRNDPRKPSQPDEDW